MKMNRNKTITISALVLLLAMVLPMFTACSSGGLEMPTEEEILTVETLDTAPVITMEATATETATEEVVDPSLNDPNWSYIPPENYIDYSDNDNLTPTPNSGKGGATVEAGGNPETSFITQSQYEKENENAVFTAADRRNAAEAKMREMLSVLWTPSEDILYSYNPESYKSREVVDEAEFAKDQLHLYAGKVYQGLPYTHGSSTKEAFLYGATEENGLYTVKLNAELLSGESAQNTARLGNNASDAIYWAWASAAPSVSFLTFSEMTEKYGVVTVGDYTLTEEQKTSIKNATDDIVLANGNDKIAAAYAKLQKADALVSDTDEKDHAMMVVSVDVVYAADGSIDLAASTVTVLEQTVANMLAFENLSDAEKEAKKGETLVVGGIDVKYSFQELIDASFIPVTAEELVNDGKIDELYTGWSLRAEADLKEGNIYKGVATSNRRIAYAVMTIKTATGGEIVQQSCSFPKEVKQTADGLFQYDLTAWTAGKEASYRRGSVISSNVEKGLKVTCTLELFFATGEQTLLRTISFTG